MVGERQPHVCCATKPIASWVDDIPERDHGDSGIAMVTQQQVIASPSVLPLAPAACSPTRGTRSWWASHHYSVACDPSIDQNIVERVDRRLSLQEPVGAHCHLGNVQ